MVLKQGKKGSDYINSKMVGIVCWLKEKPRRDKRTDGLMQLATLHFFKHTQSGSTTELNYKKEIFFWDRDEEIGHHILYVHSYIADERERERED